MDFSDQSSSSSSYYGLKLPHFFTLFAIIYVFAHKFLQNWGPKLRYDASSCLLSLFHGTPSVILALFALNIMKDTQTPENPSAIFVSRNTHFQNLVLEFSTGYFIMDLLHYFMFNPSDVLFIAHHLATLFVMLTCRFLVNHGAGGILVILVLAEMTSLLQNIWSLCRLRKGDSDGAKKLYDFLSPGFYAYYTVVRGVFAPLFVVKMGFVFAGGAANGVIPIWVWGSWLLLTVSGIFGSLLWVLNHWIVYYKEKVSEKKLR